MADALSPSHGRAIAEYAMQFVGMDDDDPALNEIITNISASLVDEWETASHLADQLNADMVLFIVPRTLPANNPLRQYREEAARMFESIRFGDNGFYHAPVEEGFWP